MDIPDNIKELMQKLLDRNYETFIIGGAVRDYIMGRTPHDYDIFTNATGEQILDIFPKGVVMGNDERQAKILTVIVDGVEISQYRANGDRTETGISLYEHLKTCDFAMNAMVCNIHGTIIDTHSGRDSIQTKTIISVGKPIDRFKEDPLRILRALRQALQLGFKIDRELCEVIIDNINLLDTLSKERIREEFIKMQRYPDCYRLLYNYGILEHILPEVTPNDGLEGGDYHNEDVLKHMFNTHKLATELTDDYRIHIAAFFHDIGKGIKKQIIDGKIHFIDHQKASADITHRFMKEFKFSNADIKYVTTMIEMHMMGNVDRLNKRTIIKFVNKLEGAGISVEDMLIMTYCDNQGNTAKPRCKFNEFYKNNNWLRKVYKMKYERMPFAIKDLAINGNDIIAIGVKDGVIIGKTLKFIFDLVLDGKISNDRHLLMQGRHAYVTMVKNKLGENNA